MNGVKTVERTTSLIFSFKKDSYVAPEYSSNIKLEINESLLTATISGQFFLTSKDEVMDFLTEALDIAASNRDKKDEALTKGFTKDLLLG